MKLKYLLLMVMAVFGIFFASSCNKLLDEKDNSISANIDNKLHEWGGAAVTAHRVDTLERIIIQGLKPTGVSRTEQLSITIVDFFGVGNYSFQKNTSNVSSYTVSGIDTSFQIMNISGSVNVESFDEQYVSGTFNFIMRTTEFDTFKIENGKFSSIVAN